MSNSLAAALATALTSEAGDRVLDSLEALADRLEQQPMRKRRALSPAVADIRDAAVTVLGQPVSKGAALEEHAIASATLEVEEGLSPTQARTEAWKRRPDLVRSYRLDPAAEISKSEAHDINKVVSALAEEIRKREPGLSENQARLRVWREHPGLRRAHEQALQKRLER